MHANDDPFAEAGEVAIVGFKDIKPVTLFVTRSSRRLGRHYLYQPVISSPSSKTKVDRKMGIACLASPKKDPLRSKLTKPED
jgi:hypothetical protein